MSIKDSLKPEFTVSPYAREKITFAVNITGCIQSSKETIWTVFTIVVDGNIGPPEFEDPSFPPESLTIKAGTTLNLKLPRIQDPDDDQYTVSFEKIDKYVIFSQITSNELFFGPSIYDHGKYKVKILLKDIVRSKSIQ